MKVARYGTEVKKACDGSADLALTASNGRRRSFLFVGRRLTLDQSGMGRCLLLTLPPSYSDEGQDDVQEPFKGDTTWTRSWSQSSSSWGRLLRLCRRCTHATAQPRPTMTPPKMAVVPFQWSLTQAMIMRTGTAIQKTTSIQERIM